MDHHLFWIASRAAGTAALLLSSAAVGVGLTMGGRLVKRRGIDLRAAHEALSLATLIAIVVHAAALLGDSYLNAGALDITVPFASGYKEPWMSIGIVSGWGLVALGVSYYFRTRIGAARWKRLHRLAYVAAVLGVVHFFLRVKKDASEPMIYAALLGLLFAVRIASAALHRRAASR